MSQYEHDIIKIVHHPERDNKKTQRVSERGISPRMVSQQIDWFPWEEIYFRMSHVLVHFLGRKTWNTKNQRRQKVTNLQNKGFKNKITWAVNTGHLILLFVEGRVWKTPTLKHPKLKKRKTTTKKGGHLPIILVDMERTWWNLICSRPKKKSEAVSSHLGGKFAEIIPKKCVLGRWPFLFFLRFWLLIPSSSEKNQEMIIPFLLQM